MCTGAFNSLIDHVDWVKRQEECKGLTMAASGFSVEETAQMMVGEQCPNLTVRWLKQEIHYDYGLGCIKTADR